MLGVMLLNEKEKEALVIELLKKGLTSREIAKHAHVSFTYIKMVRAKITGQVKEDNKPLSISSQAFKLFLAGKSLVEVAIFLDIQPEQVIKIYKDYLMLQNTSKFVLILNKHGDGIPAFLTWFAYIEENNVKPDDIVQAIDYIKNTQPMHRFQNMVLHDPTLDSPLRLS
jgi:DNA-binding CsgD family transcriptional regulator